ncbi:MAG: hypothetical protein HN741_03710, partial [Anaerolineae bacterium]|nr:hypothetical protein [Anaerolineae bacterium]
LISITIVLSPWMWRSWKIAETPFFFSGKASAILNEKFRAPPAPTPTVAPPSSFEEAPNVEEYLSVGYPIDKRPYTKPSPVFEETRPSTSLTILNHFVHNLVTSVLILPTTPFFHNLKHTLYEVSPFWNKTNGQWAGDLTTLEGLGLLLNLVLLSIGIGISWQKWRLPGLIPLGIYIAYNFSTALARTSGGRYIVPISWVVIFYFSLGVIQIIFWAGTLFKFTTNPKQIIAQKKVFTYKKGLLYLLPFFLFVSAITIIDQITPQRYPNLTKNEILEKLIQEDLLAETSISYEELGAFLQTPGSRAFLGLNLFPRYYAIGKGEYTAQKTAYSPEDFTRLGFTFIGPFGTGQAILPLEQPPSYFPHAEDIIVIGCIRKGPQRLAGAGNASLDALMVVVLGEDQTAIYTSNTSPSLQCPVSDN